MIALGLLLLGLCAGSFVSALTWRIKEDKDWVKGRSQCPACGHTLRAKDLIPIFSWLSLKGRCRYCHKKISADYPLIELTSGIVFAGSYVFWPQGLSSPGQKFLLGSWLVVLTGLLAVAIYDMRWKLFPNIVLLPTIAIAVLSRIIYIARYSSNPGSDTWLWLGALVVASGIFYALYVVSSGKWIGSGDITLGLAIGSILAKPSLALLMIFLASLGGSILAFAKLHGSKNTLQKKIPYGPYLIASTIVCLWFGNPTISWYEHFYK